MNCVFSAKQRVLAHLRTFLLNNAFKCKEMFVLALDILIWQIKRACIFPSAFIPLKPIMCMKDVFCAKNRVLADSTSFLLKNTFKRRKSLF